MSTENIAVLVAREWINTWNRHDLDAMVAHMDDDAVLTSPYVVRLLGEPSGQVKGKAQIRRYFEQVLAAYPGLEFEILTVLTGVESLVISMKSSFGAGVANMVQVNSAGRIRTITEHYHKS